MSPGIPAGPHQALSKGGDWGPIEFLGSMVFIAKTTHLYLFNIFILLENS